MEETRLIFIQGVEMVNNREKLIYLGGDIMTRGSNLARQEEYDKFKELNLPVNVYSPVMNKSINDKSNMTEEENNCLAEKIVEADVERLWNADCVVMCPEQSAIGSMCETGILYGWKYMCTKLLDIVKDGLVNERDAGETLEKLIEELFRINDKKNYFHYFDIRTNHLNEKDWRRSFSINQFLYGIILAASVNNEGIEDFDDIMKHLEDEYGDEYQISIEE